MDTEKIKAFVQDTLGCGCPEEVFRRIECVSSIQLEGFDIRYRINVGNRLLVYIVVLDPEYSLEERMPKLLEIGLRERDRAGFNRFRLVLATDNRDTLEYAKDLFKRIRKDDKVHLHLLPATSIPTF